MENYKIETKEMPHFTMAEIMEGIADFERLFAKLDNLDKEKGGKL